MGNRLTTTTVAQDEVIRFGRTPLELAISDEVGDLFSRSGHYLRGFP
jgi:hypothetical protein